MKRHASMNRIPRLVWSQVLNTWVMVAENAKGRGKSVPRRKLIVIALMKPLAIPLGYPTTAAKWLVISNPKTVAKWLVISLSFAPLAQAAPIGGQVDSGVGSVSQSGSTTTIQQSSQNLLLNWQSFNIASHETVSFLQPSVSAIAVNRIFDTNGTQILGHLNANGQVYLINPNGILFGQGAQVNVGGLVASTLDLNDASLNGTTRTFSGNGTGSVVNQGTINAANGGYVALLGNTVSNQGTVTAQLGTVALGAGSAATLIFSGNSLVHMQVDQSVLNSLAENSGLIRADGGTVIMTAGANNALLASVVNNTGVIEARTVENRNGTITLLGGMTAGTVNVGGTLDASAPNGGNGGFIETSAAHVKVASDARVTTAAPNGNSGTWLIDPTDYTIAAVDPANGSSYMSNTTLASSLGSGNVTIQTLASGTGNGDIFVNDAVSWTANSLTLNAQRNININANLNGSGTASLALEYGQGAVAAGNLSDYIIHAAVNLPAGNNFSTKLGSDGTSVNYAVITSLGAEADATTSPATMSLQGMAATANLAGNYALGSNIDASATSAWNAGAGFTPIGHSTTNFTGTFDGLGHTVSNLTINTPATSYVGLFGYADTVSVIQNVGLVGGSVSDTSGSGTHYVGGLVGYNRNGTVSNSYATGSVSGTGSGTNYVGGLVGRNGGTSTVSNSYATGSVSGTSGDSVGGLVGRNDGTVSNSYATGSVSGSGSDVGGLVGANNNGGTLSNSYWDSSVNTTGIGSGTTTGATGLTTTYMQQQSSFTSWDFANTWIVYNGYTYPLLRSFMTPLTVTAINDTKTYNGLAYSGGNGVTSSSTTNANLLGTLSYSGTSQGATNAGSYAIAPSGLYSTQQQGGYAINFVNGTLTVDPRPVNLTGSRVYDGMTAVSSGIFTLGNLVSGETLALSGSGSVASKNVSAGTQTVTLGTLALGDGSGLAANYTFTGGTQSADITAANLTLSTSNVTKIYDGGFTAAGTASVTGGTLFSGDTLSGGTFAFTDKNVGSGNKTVTTTGVTVGDGVNNGNYNVSYANTATGTITPANLLVTANNASKTYGATQVFTGSEFISSGLQNSETIGSVSLASTGAIATASVSGSPYAITASAATGGTFSAGNYAISYANGALTITPLAVNLAIALTGNKVYDGTPTFSTGQLSISNAVSGDVVSLSAGAADTANENVGVNKPFVSFSGLALAGASAGNYTLTGVSGTGTITAKAVTLTAPVVSKTYDGGLTYTTTASDLTALATSLVGSDTVTAATIAYTNKNAGTGNKTVNLNAATINDGNSGANYTVTLAGNTTSTITKAALALNAVTDSKIYDGTTTSVGTASVGTLYGTDTVTGATQAFGSKNVSGTNGSTLSVTGYTLNDGNGGANYTVTSNTALGTITPKAITVSGITADTKVYDRTTSATLSLGAVSFGGIISDDSVSVATGSISGSFADKNVGTNKAVNLSGVALSGGDAGNYTLNGVAGVTGTITPAALALNAVTGSKVYDATTSSSGTVAKVGLQGADTVNSLSQSFASKNVLGANASTLAVNGGYTVNDGNSGNNYTVTTHTAAGTITKAALALNAVTGSKVYDATTSSSGTVAKVGLQTGDSVSSLSQSFASKNVLGANASTLAVNGGYTVNDGNSGNNYTVTTHTAAGTITPANLLVTANNASKTYGATQVFTGSEFISTGLQNNETIGSVSLASTGAIATASVSGSPYAITASAATGGTFSAGNYAISYANGALTITPLAVNLAIALTGNKVYDGTPTFSTGQLSISNAVSGDVVSLSAGAADTANENVGVNKPFVSFSGLALAGASAGNYTLTGVSGTGTITTAALSINAVTDSRIYNGTTLSSMAPALTGTVFSGDTLSALTQSFASKNVMGTNGSTLNVGSYTLTDGNGGGNYTVTTHTATGTITQAALTLSTSNVTKTYDGGLTAAGSAAVTSGTLFTGDTLAGGSFAFTNKNVGSGNKTVTATGVTVNDGNSGGNYTVSYANNTTSTINPAATPEPSPPPEPGTPPPQLVLNAMAQLESDVLSSQTSAQPGALSLSPAITVTQSSISGTDTGGNASMSIRNTGKHGILLQIVDGAVRLPDYMVKSN